MGRELPKHGHVEDEHGSDPESSTTTRVARHRDFGELDLDSFGTEPETGARSRRLPVEEPTRVAEARALADAISRTRRPPAKADGKTRVAKLSEVPAPSSQITKPPSGSEQLGDERVAAMRDLYAQGDAEAALLLASVVAHEFAGDAPRVDSVDGPPRIAPIDEVEIDLDLDDDDHAEHTAIVAASARSFRARAMSSRQIPRLLLAPHEISSLPMDPRGAFLLMQVDGMQTMEEILDVCAMPEAEALEIIERLCELGAITLD